MVNVVIELYYTKLEARVGYRSVTPGTLRIGQHKLSFTIYTVINFYQMLEPAHNHYVPYGCFKQN